MHCDDELTVEIAEPHGFCFGVRRAVRLAEEAVREHGPVWTFGPLMHNPQGVARLAAVGIAPLPEGDAVAGKIIIIRSHGATIEAIDDLREKGARVIDATCPLVQRAHERARELSRSGYDVVIVGERAHPEVKGIVSRAPGAFVVEEPGHVNCLQGRDRVGIIAQTTQSQDLLGEVVRQVVLLGISEIVVFNTICSATADRQAAAAALAERVECMFVLGGAQSANTRRLAQTCRRHNPRTRHLETYADLAPEMIRAARRVGVAAGASTPDWVVREFVDALCRLRGRRKST